MSNAAKSTVTVATGRKITVDVCDVIRNAPSATALIKYVIGEKFIYSDYIRENDVTNDDLAKHVDALTKAAFPGVKSSVADDATDEQRECKAFRDKIRAGLKYALNGKNAPKANAAGTENILTKDGLARIAGMDEAEILALVLAEIAARMSAE